MPTIPDAKIPEDESHTQQMAIAGLILAGGRSQRMGSDKALMTLAGRPLLSHAITRLAPQVSEIWISAHGEHAAASLPSSLVGEGRVRGAKVVVDRRPGHLGPLAGIEAGLLATQADWLLTVAVDVPFFPLDLATRLYRSVQGTALPAIAAWRGRSHPVMTLWPGQLLSWISGELDHNHLALGRGLATIPHRVVDFSHDTDRYDPFFNVNTLEDVYQAEQIIGWKVR
ncbi:MAG: molybdenum cofactor guanylyltransferase [Magnetococcales bacterium]|nr:molybdenum cofactor guanylyltransferase [Magnetococcales bacterium]